MGEEENSAVIDGRGVRLNDVINVLKLILMVMCGAISFRRDAMGVVCGQAAVGADRTSPLEHEWAVQPGRLGRGHPVRHHSSHRWPAVSTGALFYPFTSRGRPCPAPPFTLPVAIL
jgi:hypothetical protein